MADTCESCRFGQQEDLRRGWGKCRRYPPKVYSHNPSGNWPVVDASDWCGEYKPASGGGVGTGDDE